MTAVYADFLSNWVEVESFPRGIWEKACEGPKIPLDKVPAKPGFWREWGYGRVLEPAAAELALGGLPGLVNGV